MHLHTVGAHARVLASVQFQLKLQVPLEQLDAEVLGDDRLFELLDLGRVVNRQPSKRVLQVVATLQILLFPFFAQ